MTKAPVFPSAKDHFRLLLISIPRKSLPVTTDCIHTTVEISAVEFTQTMIGGGNPINFLSNECLDIDRACHKYFLGTGKSFFMNFYF